MYFYVDESGHTGARLFDENQPILYYGVLSSRFNIDVLAEDSLAPMRREIRAPRLHASELGINGLEPLGQRLSLLRRRFDLRFSIYRVNKPDQAVICFFDQVFDQGNNPAVPWHGYWTPMRYIYLLKLNHIFTPDLLERAWAARVNTNSAKAEAEVTAICRALMERVEILPDARSKQIFTDVLKWAAEHPASLHYNAPDKEQATAVTPNILGFQSVLHGIAQRMRARPTQRAHIIVDQQGQFNRAQQSLAQMYAKARGFVMPMGPGLPVVDHRGMPTDRLNFSSSTKSAGLELVDIYLWTFKRFLEGKQIPASLVPLIKEQLHRGRSDEISLNALAARWGPWFDELPDPTPEAEARGRELQAKFEEQRLRAMHR